MTSNEISLEQLNSLSPEERALALEILKEISQDGHSELLDDLKYSEYDEICKGVLTEKELERLTNEKNKS